MSDNGNGQRAVLYARCSGDDRGNDDRNLQGQLEMARQYALAKGYTIVAELAEDDKGASGAAFELPQLNHIREMAAEGAFDVLVPREIDRLSRNLAKQLIVEEELRRAGVSIEYAIGGAYPDTPEGRLSKHMRATIAEYEREKIVERTARGKQNKVKSGSVLVANRPPYGYRVAEVDGKTMLTVYEPEAHVVRLMFTWYIEGEGDGGPLSLRTIARKLTEIPIPTYADIHSQHKKRGLGYWQASTVSQILRTIRIHAASGRRIIRC